MSTKNMRDAASSRSWDVGALPATRSGEEPFMGIRTTRPQHHCFRPERDDHRHRADASIETVTAALATIGTTWYHPSARMRQLNWTSEAELTSGDKAQGAVKTWP
jgi:hypothetical protein